MFANWAREKRRWLAWNFFAKNEARNAKSAKSAINAWSAKSAKNVRSIEPKVPKMPKMPQMPKSQKSWEKNKNAENAKSAKLSRLSRLPRLPRLLRLPRLPKLIQWDFSNRSNFGSFWKNRWAFRKKAWVSFKICKGQICCRLRIKWFHFSKIYSALIMRFFSNKNQETLNVGQVRTMMKKECFFEKKTFSSF